MYTLKQLEPPYGIQSQLSSYPQFKSTCRRHRERRRPQELQAIKQHTDTKGELLGLKEWAVTVEALRDGEQTVCCQSARYLGIVVEECPKGYYLMMNP